MIAIACDCFCALRYFRVDAAWPELVRILTYVDEVLLAQLVLFVPSSHVVNWFTVLEPLKNSLVFNRNFIKFPSPFLDIKAFFPYFRQSALCSARHTRQGTIRTTRSLQSTMCLRWYYRE